MSKLMERFQDTNLVPLSGTFVGMLQQIARLNGLDEDAVWEAWQQYDRASEMAGQSALVWELCQIKGWKLEA